ncbi:SPOR domain-containing protein [Aliihoeflea sp. PC F10.4]
MADNPFKRPDESGFLDNDPFAELMRMAEAPRASQPDPDPAANENFDIDLEREMLGDFDEPENAPVQSAVADHWTRDAVDTAFEPQTAPEFGEPAEDDFADLDLSLDLELDDEGPHLPLSAADDLVAPPITFETEAEDDVPEDFDARSHALFAATPEFDDRAARTDDEFDRAFAEFDRQENEPVFEDQPQPDFQQPVEPAAQMDVERSEEPFFAELSDDADHEDIESFDFDLAIDEDDRAQVFTEELPVAPISHDDFDFNFADDPSETSHAQVGSSIDTFAHDDVLQAGPADDHFVAGADLSVGDNAGWSVADLQAEGPVEAVSVPRDQAAAWAEPELRRDVSDDDDILGDIESWLSADPAPAPVASVEPTSFGSEPIHEEEAFAPLPIEESQPVSAPPQPLSLEDELGALLGEDDGAFDASFERAPAQATAYSAGEPASDDLEFALDFDLGDMADEQQAAQPVAADTHDLGGAHWDDDAPAPADEMVAEQAAPRKTGPLAMLAALAPAAMARFGGGERTAAAKVTEPVQPATPLFGMARKDRPVSPEIETVEIDEQPAALVDDLDIPELAEPEEVTPLFSPDDLEAELDVAFGSLAPEDEEPAVAAAPATSSSDTIPLQGSYTEDDYGYMQEPQSANADDDFGDIDFDYDPDAEPVGAQPPKDGMRRKYFILGGVAAVALVGGFGYFMTGGPIGEGLPAIVRADSEPVRVRPENRGGAVVPNQNSQAYQRATGATGTAGGGQESLMTSVEEPLDVRSAVAPQPSNDFPMVGMDDIPMLDDRETVAMLSSMKSDERLGGVEEIIEEDGISVAPRRVRTMVVRPDGTLVAREELPAASTREELQASAAAAMQTQASALPRIEDAQPVGSIAPVQGEVLPDDPVMPDTVGVVPSRPQARSETSTTAQAPVQVASNQPAQTAPVAQTATAPASGEWSMQIASQPSAEGAQSSYEDLARRYGSVLQGRGVNIVRADLDGMGTFYRVRIPANTRDEAVQLCTQYQAAGGSCFVSR